MANFQIPSRGDCRVFLCIASATFLTGLIFTCFILPAAFGSEGAIVDLKATMPAAEEMPQHFPTQSDAAQITLPTQQSDEDIVTMLAQSRMPQVYEKQTVKESWRTVRMKVTGYCACTKCCGKNDGITACNYHIKKGDAFVAADKSYGFGTQMVIPGYNKDRAVKVLDRGGAIKGNHLDLFFHSHSQAREWGVKYLDVLIKVDSNV